MGKRPEFSRNLPGDHWIKQEDKGAGTTFINAQLVRRAGKFLDRVKIIRFDERGEILERLDANHAIHRGQEWLLIDVLRIDADGRSKRLDTYTIQTPLTEDELLGVGTAPEEIPFWQLTQVAERIEKSGTNGKPYLVQYHSLIALPMFLIAMILVAATVCLRFVRFGQVVRMILGGILFGFVLYTATTLITSLGSNGVVPPVVAAWAPVIVAILFGMSMLLHQEDG